MNMQQSKRLVSEAQPNAVLQADCLAVMRYFRSCSAEFVLTHPPYFVHCRSHAHIRLNGPETANPGSRIYVLEPLW